MVSLGDLRESVSDVVGLVRVLRDHGLVELSRPQHVVLAAKRGERLGPIAALTVNGGEKFADDPCVTDEHGTITYGDLDWQSNALANTLLGMGLARGSVIAVIARDHRGLLITMAAAGKAGLRLVMMNTGFGITQFAEVAEREKVGAILYDEEFGELAAALPTHLPRILTWLDGQAPQGIPTLDEIAETGDPTAPAEPDSAAGMVILTSGTTGLPKGARRGAMSPFASVLLLDRIPFPRKGTSMIASPLFHATGFATCGVNLALGNRIVLRRRFDAEQTVAALSAERVEMLVAVPTMLHRMVALGPDVLGKYDLSALKVIVIAGSALSPALSEAIQDTFGDVLYNLYGSTEVAIASIAQPAELRAAPGTVGRAPISSRLRLYDADDKRITATNVRGRLFVKNGVPFEGYTDGRNKAIIDGYMSTGDMGRFDTDGLLFIEGRDDDMIVSGGENVYPLEVENLLAEHPAVDDVAVIGVPDDEFGTRLRAFVVRADHAEPTPEDIKAHVKTHLARYKVPRDVVFVDDLPRNPTGKLVRRQLPTGPL